MYSISTASLRATLLRVDSSNYNYGHYILLNTLFASDIDCSTNHDLSELSIVAFFVLATYSCYRL